MLTKDTIFYAVLNPYFAGYSGYTIRTSLTGSWLAGACSIFRATYVYIINLKKELVEKASFHFTALAFAKESYNKIKAELEKVCDELIKELKEKSGN